jgi:hypothetical protein
MILFARFISALVVAAAFTASSPSAQAAGALVVGACGAYGEAHDFPNAAAARANASRQCKGKACKLAVTLRGNCAAFAVDAGNPCGASAYASGPHLGRAQNAALRACFTKGGRDCVIRMFVCDGRG